MKIIQVLNQFLPDHVAGTEMYVLGLLANLDKTLYESVVVIPNYGESSKSEYIYEDLRIIKYAEPSVVDRELQMGRRKPDGLDYFIEVLKREKPDIVHFQELAGSNGIALHHVIAAKELGYKVIMTLHVVRNTSVTNLPDASVDVFNIRQGAMNFYRQKGFSKNNAFALYSGAVFLQKLKIDTSKLGKIGTALSVPQLVKKKKENFLKLVTTSDKMIAISHWYYNALLNAGVDKNKLVFIQQGINAIPVNSRGGAKPEKRLKLIFVGRISHFKGVKMLINVVRQIPGEEVLLDIYGDSGEDKNYISDCHKLVEGIPHINFKGRLSPKEVIGTMSEYDLMIHPSTITEMSPLVIREAFAAGIPVLSSDNEGSREQVKDGINGWLFEMNNEEDLSKKLKMLIDKPGLLKEAAEHFPLIRTFKAVALEYQKIYEEVTSKNTLS